MVGQGKKAGSSKKTPVQDADDSYIVFSNSKDDSKGKGKKPEAKSSTSKDGVDKLQPAGEEAPKKPDTRKLIGGASWTGKLPVNILSEHCQKQRWEKPEYTMSKFPEGFSSMVILKAINSKTKEMTVLPPFKLPPTHKHLAMQPSAVEARHFAATYALFRVCSMRNIHMMLPPNYRDLWKGELKDLKEEDMKDGRVWMYEADPFAAKQEREESQAAIAKKREEVAKAKAKEADQPSIPGGPSTTGGSRTVSRGWTMIPKVDMGKRTRVQVEELIRKHVVWNPHGVALSEFQRRNIINELAELGFRRSHIEEAASECKDREEILEWLLIHVPEDDLPRWSLPEGYSAGISMASGNIRRETIINRLAETGYSIELCENLLDKNNEDERNAAEALQNLLFCGNNDGIKVMTDAVSGLALESGNDDSIWAEEQDTLESIFGPRFSKISSVICQIELEVSRSSKPHTLSIRKSKLYPATPPIVSISSPGLPAYIRLSIYRQVIQYAVSDLLGEPMVFNLVDWLEAEISRISETPGRLRDISTASSSLGKSFKPASGQNRYLPRKPAPLEQQSENLESIALLNRWQTRQETAQQKRMLAGRRSLPAWGLRDDIVDTVNGHQVTIISGETGSGKSTQSVQFILDDMIQRKLGSAVNIICTQPRRISALGLADRVSDERCTTVGDEVGYIIRGESKQKRGTTKITFVTTGVLLRRLQTSGGSRDDIIAALADISHVVVDEVHERSLDTDFLLVLLRDVLKARKDLKVILMSATLDAGVFERYFQGSSSVGKIEIQGRTFPVEDYYLDDVARMTGFSISQNDDDADDSGSKEQKSIASTIQGIGMRINYNFIVAAITAIDAELGSNVDGGILIFLPGVMEINRAIDLIRTIPNVYALPLHASLTSVEQRRVFPPAPKGKRKVIAATNVAETSITIEDIVAVIDTGKVKETSFDPINNMVKLEEVWASRAACKQRRGRAGRVRAGKCYKLYTRNAEAKMAERPQPEIRRVPLEQLCLSVRAMGIKEISAFLASALTPPETTAVEGAIDLLGKMGALDDDELTALGRHLAMIPADLRCGKLMVYGATFGCLEPCLTIAAILTVKSPFISPQAEREASKAARSSFGQNQGDLLADLYAYEAWAGRHSSMPSYAVRAWCHDNFLSSQTLSDIASNRSQYLSSLKEASFIPAHYHSPSHQSHSNPGSVITSLNAHSASKPLLRALIAAAVNPQLASIIAPPTKYAPSLSGAIALDPTAKSIRYTTPDSGRVFIHPSSTLFDAQSFPGNSVFLSYFNKIATSKVFIRESSPCNVYSVLMFGGKVELDTLGRGLVIGGEVRVRGWARIGVLVGRLRGMLDRVLELGLERPGEGLGEVGESVVGIVRRLVELDGMDA